MGLGRICRKQLVCRMRITVVAIVAVLAAGCTAHPRSNQPAVAPDSSPAVSPGSSSPAGDVSSSPPPLAIAVRPQDQAAVVIAGSTPQQISIATTRAMLTTAPVVIVSAADPASISQASRDAQRLSLPIIVSDGANVPGAPSAHGSPGSAAGRSAADALDGELRRLDCVDVLGIGRIASPGDVHVVSDSAQLPAVVGVADDPGTTVLVHAGTEPATVAAAATARAAGATVVAVHGSDPRADPFAVSAIAHSLSHHVLAVGSDFGPAGRLASRFSVAQAGTQLPGGAQTVFPGRRFVALYGHPGGDALGVLGAQDVDASITRARDLASQYDNLSDVPVVPTFEIIATVAAGAPGRDGNYSNESSVDSLRPWVEKAEAAGFYVVLDLQPGRADPLAQAQLYTSLLQLPDVGLAVDPEWALGPNQQPLEQIGSIDSSRINAVAAWLDSFTASKHLPQKLFVVHQFRLSMIGNESKLKTNYDNIAILIHMDGQGGQANKDATWRSVVAAAPKGVPFGWKNFYKEDHPMLTPEQTMAHKPQPMMISYQ